jgi:hypothetical protein
METFALNFQTCDYIYASVGEGSMSGPSPLLNRPWPVGCPADAFLSASGQEAAHLDEMASNLRKLRDDLYAYTGDWNLTN